MTPATLIRGARLEAELTQAELAKRAGTYQPIIARYESGDALPSLPTLERLLLACGKRLNLTAVATSAANASLNLSSARSHLGPLARKLRQKRPLLLEALERRGAKRPVVFGSVARGEDREDSDIDLLVEMPPLSTLVDLVGLQLEVSEILGVSTDVATPDMLKPHILEAARREGVAL